MLSDSGNTSLTAVNTQAERKKECYKVRRLMTVVLELFHLSDSPDGLDSLLVLSRFGQVHYDTPVKHLVSWKLEFYQFATIFDISFNI